MTETTANLPDLVVDYTIPYPAKHRRAPATFWQWCRTWLPTHGRGNRRRKR